MKRRPGLCTTCKGAGFHPCERGHDKRRRCALCRGCPVCEGAGVVVVVHEDVHRYVAAYLERFGVRPARLPGALR